MRQFKMGFLQKPSNGREQAARILRLAAVGKKFLDLAGSTKFAVKDMTAVQSCLLHLPAVDLREINCPALFHRLPCGEVRCKLLRNFLTNLVATAANTGAYRRVDVVGGRAEISLHPFNSATNNAGGRSAPPRMDSAYGPKAAIEQEKRNAIGRANANASACLVRN